MATIKKGITNTTPINAGIAELIGELSGNEALLLFSGLSKRAINNPTPSFSKNLDRLREEGEVTLPDDITRSSIKLKPFFVNLMFKWDDEPDWAPLLEFYRAKNKYLADELEFYLLNLGKDDNDLAYQKSGGSSSETEIQDEDEGGCAGSSAEQAPPSQDQDEDDDEDRFELSIGS
jgi:hypothetical protein